jgi:hypothetical protein
MSIVQTSHNYDGIFRNSFSWHWWYWRWSERFWSRFEWLGINRALNGISSHISGWWRPCIQNATFQPALPVVDSVTVTRFSFILFQRIRGSGQIVRELHYGWLMYVTPLYTVLPLYVYRHDILYFHLRCMGVCTGTYLNINWVLKIMNTTVFWHVSPCSVVDIR